MKGLVSTIAIRPQSPLDEWRPTKLPVVRLAPSPDWCGAVLGIHKDGEVVPGHRYIRICTQGNHHWHSRSRRHQNGLLLPAGCDYETERRDTGHVDPLANHTMQRYGILLPR